VLKSPSTPLLVGLAWLTTTAAIAIACVGARVSPSTALLLLAPCVGPIVVVLLIGSNRPECHPAELLHRTAGRHST
jgi:hypothetical protein